MARNIDLAESLPTLTSNGDRLLCPKPGCLNDNEVKCHFNPSGQGQVAANRRQSLVFRRQHDGNDRLSVIAGAEDKFQGEPLALCRAPISWNAMQIK